jgi:hypothetical protein
VPRPSRGELERASAEHREREAREREWRAGAEGRSERALSRTAHRGAGRERALGLMRDEFPGLRHERSRPLDPPAGYRVAGFHSDRVARLEAEDGSPGPVVSSTLPLRTEDEGGEKAPVDLAFEELGAASLLAGEVGGFAPRNGLVGLRAPSLLNQGFALGRDGFMRMHVAGAPASVGTLAGNDVFYHEVARDTDLLVTAMPFGFETFTQLRSPESPERLDFRFELPAGASVEATQDGGARVVRDGAILLLLLPPDAVDAQGQRLPARYVVSGATVELHAAHRDRDVAYPVAVDPIGYVPGGDRAVLENWVNDPKSWYLDSTLDITGWKPHSYWSGDGTDHWGYTWPFKFCSQSICSGYGNGLYVQAYDNTSYPSYSQGEWYFPTWGDVYIPRAEFAHIYFSNIVDAFLRASIWSGTLGRYTALKDYHHNPWWDSPNYYTAISSSSDWTHGTSTSINLVLPNAPGQSWQTRTYGPYAYLGGALIYLQDRSAPTRPAVWGHPTGWVDKATGTFFGKATDGGLGVKWFRFRYPTGEQWREHPCLGDRRKPCPGGPRASSSTSEGYAWSHANLGFAGDPFTYDTTNWPEGVNTISMDAADATSRFSAPESRQVMVDHTGPDITLTGPLYDERDTAWVLEGAPRRLRVDAVEGSTASASQQRSGLKSIAVYVDGNFVSGTGDVACPAGSCALGHDYDFVADGLPEGWREIVVAARDRLDHRSTRTFQVYVADESRSPTDESDDGDADTSDTATAFASSTCRPDADPAVGSYCATDDDTDNNAALRAAYGSAAPLPTARLAPNQFGISEQQPPDLTQQFWTDQDFLNLGLRRARIIVPYNVMAGSYESQYSGDRLINLDGRVDAGERGAFNWFYNWIKNARISGVEPLVTLEKPIGLGNEPGYLPAYDRYRASVRALVRAYPEIAYISSWNEPNLRYQPLFNSPERAAKLWRVAADVCKTERDAIQKPRCYALAGEFHDGPNILTQRGRLVRGDPEWDIYDRQFPSDKSYLDLYLDELQRGPQMPILWSIHAYTARKSYLPQQGRRLNGLKGLIAKTRGLVWLTEQNGVMREGTTTIATEVDQNTELVHLLETVIPPRTSRITRFYLYQWRDDRHWDSALLGWRDGVGHCLRPVYSTFIQRTNPGLPVDAPRARPPCL